MTESVTRQLKELEERIEALELSINGTPPKREDGLQSRTASLERDRNLIRWALAGLLGLGSAVIKWWADHQGPHS